MGQEVEYRSKQCIGRLLDFLKSGTGVFGCNLLGFYSMGMASVLQIWHPGERGTPYQYANL